MSNRQTIRKYDIPGIGRVELIHDSDCEAYGPYYARINTLGMVVKGGQNLHQIRFKTGVAIKKLLEEKQSKLEEQLAPVKSSLLKMHNSTKLTVLDNFEVKE